MGCQRFIYNAKVPEDRRFRAFARKSLQHTGQFSPRDQQYAQFIGEGPDGCGKCHRRYFATAPCAGSRRMAAPLHQFQREAAHRAANGTLFTAQYAVNILRIRRMQPIISA